MSLPRLLVLLFASILAYAQPIVPTYTVARTVTATSEKVTIQHPATGNPRRTRIKVVQVEMAVDGVVAFSINGTAATTTAATEVNLNNTGAGTAQAFVASNAGAGTAIWPTVSVKAGVPATFTFEGLELIGVGNTINFNVTCTPGSSAEIKVGIKYEESF